MSKKNLILEVEKSLENILKLAREDYDLFTEVVENVAKNKKKDLEELAEYLDSVFM